MDRLVDIVNYAKASCKDLGLHFTRKRQLVLTHLVQSTKALSAYELADICRINSNENLSVMSVYRILDFLAQIGIVHKLKSINGYVACCNIKEEDPNSVAIFLICRQCHRIKETHVDYAYLQHLKDATNDEQFTLSSHQIELECQCQECLNATQSSAD